MKNSLIKTSVLAMTIAFTTPIFASSQMHYGAPTINTNKITATNNTPLVIINHNFDDYDIYTTQADGKRDVMKIYHYAPYNMISIDNPTWPVYVQINFANTPIEFYSNLVTPFNPTVNIGYMSTTGKQGDKPQVSLH